MIRIADKALHQQWAAYATWLRTHEREHLHRALALIRNSARANATARWNGGQFEEACTERIITIYAAHLARAIAPKTPLPHPRAKPPLEQAPTRCAISAAITVLSPHELLTLTMCLESLATDADERRDTDWRRTKPGTARRERELSGARPAVTPSESVRRMAGHGERLARAESPTGEVDLAGLPLALNAVGHGRRLLTEHVHHLAGCRTIAEYCTAEECGVRSRRFVEGVRHRA